ncbi:MAG: hypothetical protein KDI82_07115, partial [Gammaproteobacteria bacterium]|nr:hypothetical protein [Gammaproteobacteria bacterium]
MKIIEKAVDKMMGKPEPPAVPKSHQPRNPSEEVTQERVAAEVPSNRTSSSQAAEVPVARE